MDTGPGLKSKWHQERYKKQRELLRTMSAIAWDGHCVYGNPKSIEAVRALLAGDRTDSATAQPEPETK